MRVFISLVLLSAFSMLSAMTATEIITQVDKNARGKTVQMTLSVEIQRPTWSRTIEMKSWGKGTEYSLVYITAPAKEKGQAFLKRQNELWNWIPSIGRMIKMPPSMMSQSWMGSDFKNDDLVKESSVVKDYHHELLGVETKDGFECYKIKLSPKNEVAVIWGKIITWVSKKDFIQIRGEFYDEDEELIHTQVASEIKKMGGRIIATQMEIIPSENPNQKTIMKIKSALFDEPISDGFFSQRQLKRIR